MNVQQFGATVKQKHPEYKDYSDEEIGQRVLKKYPQYQSQITEEKKSIGGLLKNAVSDVKNVGAGSVPLIKNALTMAPAFSSPGSMIASLVGSHDVRKAIADTAIQGSASTAQEYGSLISHPLQHAYEHPVNTAMDILPFVKGAQGIHGAVEPHINTGAKIGATAEKIGPLQDAHMSQLFEKYFGTSNVPHPDIFTKARVPGDLVEKVQPVVRSLIDRKAQTGTGEINQQTTGSNLLQERISQRAAGRASKGVQATEEQRVRQQLGNRLSDMLHELSPELEKYDKAFSQQQKVKGVARKAVPYGGGAAGILFLLSQIKRLI